MIARLSALLLCCLTACGEGPPREATAPPSLPIEGPMPPEVAAVLALTSESATPYSLELEQAQAEAAGARDPQPVIRALAVAEADLRVGIGLLDAIETPEARAYAAFFRLMQPDPPPALAEAAAAALLREFDRTATTGAVKRGPPLSPGQAALALRFVLEVQGTTDTQCWVAARFPEAWFEGFGPYYGSSRDGIGRGCGPGLDPVWAAKIEAALLEAAAPQTGPCGTMISGQAAALDAELHRLEVQPRHAAAEADALAIYQQIRAQFCADTPVAPPACAKLAVALAPPAAWVAAAERAAQQKGLSAEEAQRAVANTALGVQSLRLEMEGTCPHGP